MTTTSPRTSTTHPLAVSWMSIDAIDGPGRLGVTLAPGRRSLSTRGFAWDRQLDDDLDALRNVHHADVLVTLVPEAEARRVGLTGLAEGCRVRGINHHIFPITDGSVPGPDELPAFHALMVRLVASLSGGARVVVHCQAGLGRAGTVAGCLLVAFGRTPAQALRELTTRRSPRCPENEVQREFIRAFHRWHRTAGAVLGAAIGDALGHPTEFMSMDSIRARYGAAGVRGFELWRQDGAGARYAPYTDDTQLAEVVLRALVDGAPHAESTEGLERLMGGLGPAIAQWSRDPLGGHRAPGNACLSGARRLATGVSWREAGSPRAGGCGSAMRAWPFGLLFPVDDERTRTWAAEHSLSTHGHPLALASCAAISVGTAHALAGAEPAMVVAAMVDAASAYDQTTSTMLERAAREATQGTGPEVTLDRLRGWAGHEAVAAAAYVFLRHADDPRAALLEGANTPGDSDSIASLAGALVGARCGITSLPADWVRDVERSQALQHLARRAATC